MARSYSVGSPPVIGTAAPAYANGLAAPATAMAGLWDRAGPAPAAPAQPVAQPAPAKAPPATETIGRRAGALSDEIDFPAFVASLIHGTFDAIVDASIRQMESFADLVSAVAKPLERFKDENVTANEARDWLIAQHPQDLMLARSDTGAQVVPRIAAGEDEGEPAAPAWLTDYGVAEQPLTAELIEETLVPAARERIARDRMSTLSTMVMLGLNRVVVKDGSINARLRFRAAAADRTKVDYAVSDDPATASSSGGWGSRGSPTYAAPSTKVSTVGVNAQTDSDLKAELFGEVKINFASETVPLDRFVDDARRVLLERAARPAPVAPPPAAPVGNALVPTTALPPPLVAAPLPPQPVRP